LRSSVLTKPIFRWARRAMPTISATEREALEAGDIWWEGDLFSGNPDWEKLRKTPRATLSAEEQAFIDGPVNELCGMLDDWKSNFETGDLPPEAWAYMKAERFFGIIIPKQYGGLGFSNFAHSEIVRKVSSRSLIGAVSVMVPNSLGPGELLMQFGTTQQRDYWLPRLAEGKEIPCFGLTSPEAGSDAAAMVDRGVVCKYQDQGREVLGIRLDFRKRYITLAPIATVLGLAFRLYDPDHLLGEKAELGITLALVPTDTPGVEIGRRHLPAMQKFQNGPTSGQGVLIPLDNVIGGAQRVGQGWKMLMSALAAGRGISLPSQSAAGAAFLARTTGAYARIREQFNLPIGKFEGVREKLARIAGTAYMLDAARHLTCAGLDLGHKPAVIAPIMKLHATERLRQVVDDAMDILGGKAIIDGPRNFIGNLYRAVPVAITVEGANILTRNLIVFGLGAIRCHPHLLQEMAALEEKDPDVALQRFDVAFWKHVGHTLATLLHAFGRSWTSGFLSPGPHAGPASHAYKQLGRYAAAFALTADAAFLTLGGALKRKEMISARLGDILAELYLLSAVLKRFEEENYQDHDLALVHWCMAQGTRTIETRLDEVLANLPNRWLAGFLRWIVLPWGVRARGPSDKLTNLCAETLLEPSATRDRLTAGLYVGVDSDPVSRLEEAFRKVTDAAPLVARLREAHVRDRAAALAQGLLTAAEAAQLQAMDAAVAEAVAVDDFAPEELAAPRPAAPIPAPRLAEAAE
jgi:acyl-CoA dehydrogenase